MIATSDYPGEIWRWTFYSTDATGGWGPLYDVMLAAVSEPLKPFRDCDADAQKKKPSWARVKRWMPPWPVRSLWREFPLQFGHVTRRLMVCLGERRRNKRKRWLAELGG